MLFFFVKGLIILINYTKYEVLSTPFLLEFKTSIFSKIFFDINSRTKSNRKLEPFIMDIIFALWSKRL